MKNPDSKHILLLFFVAIFTSHCASKPRESDYTTSTERSPSSEAPILYKQTLVEVRSAQFVTSQGECAQPAANPIGTKILYVCKNRNAHTHTEIYELSLETGIERRISYQDADVSNPMYTVSEKIIYSSTSDEHKEFLIKNLFDQKTILAQNKPVALTDATNAHSEIYMRDRYGREIERISFREGYDGRACYSPDAIWQAYYTCQNGERTSLCRSHLLTKKSEVFIDDAEFNLDFPSVSNDQKVLTWIQTHKNTLVQKLNLTSIANKSQRLSFELPPGQYKDLSFFSTNEVLFSFSQSNGPYKVGTFNFVTREFSTLVDAKLFTHEALKGASLEHPYFIKSKNQLLLTAKKSNSLLISVELPPQLQVLETTVANTRKDD